MPPPSTIKRSRREEEAHQRQRAHPPAALERLRDRQLDQHDQQRVRQPHRPDPALADAGVVLGERRQQREDLVTDRDEEHVQPQQPDEVAVAQDGAVPQCVTVGLLGLVHAGFANRRQHPDEDEEGRRVEQEQRREAAGIARARDQAADDAAQAQPEVHADPLQRESGMGPLGRGQAREQRRLARPEAGGARSFEREQRERVPGLPDQREERERGRLQHQAEQQRVPAAETVDDRAGLEAGRQGADSASGEGETRRREQIPRTLCR